MCIKRKFLSRRWFLTLALVTLLCVVLMKLPFPANIMFPLYSRFSSNSSVYGSGTNMVDVKGPSKCLDEYSTTKINLNAGSNVSKKITHQTNERKLKCFRLFWKEANCSLQQRMFLYMMTTGCKTLMTLELLPGRSGNQMFQIASLLGTAYKNDFLPIINPRVPLASWLDLPNLIDVNLTGSGIFTVKQSGMYYRDVNKLDRSKNWTISGYFQSWKYFQEAKDVIKKAFNVKEKYLKEAKSFLANISRRDYQNVCVHVRRGDFDDAIMIRKGYSQADLGFIYQAMAFYRRKLKHVQFIVLSDGIFWCRENIKGKNIIFSPFYRPAEDMALMVSCNHVIVTSGTFGWWGAWLAGGVTVYYKDFPRKGSWLGSQIKRTDYYPADWIGL